MLAFACALVWSRSAHASFIAYDSASDPAYSAGWTNGSNGGYGFGPWVLAHPSLSNAFGLGASTANGDGLDDGIIGGLPSDGDIGSAFRLRGESATATAGRLFLSGALNTGETFSIYFDNGIQNETVYGIDLYETDSSFSPINLAFTVFLHLGSGYEYADIGSNFGVLPHGTEGIRLDFTLTGEVDYGSYTNYAYSASLTRLDGATASWTGEVGYRPNYVQVRHLIPVGGDPVAEAFYVNNMSIVPEPSAAVFLILGAGFVARYARKRFRYSVN